MLTLKEQIHTLEDYSQPFSNREEIRNGLKPQSLKIFQMNLGKKCNQACLHCHVEAGPLRTEMMSNAVIDKCIDILKNCSEIEVVDITGGAPEMHPRFRDIVTQSLSAGKHVIDRCNLTILEEPGYEYLYDFLASNQVEIVASLPHFAQSRTDQQRGKGVFDKSMTALKKLNSLGYSDTLPLNLVYNPQGLLLSGSQSQLEREFKENLKTKFGIYFNSLYCINNIPINRFLDALVRKNKFEDYMSLLVQAYNPQTVEGLMCRQQISVGYDGGVFDCDFNQMLNISSEKVPHIFDFDYNAFMSRTISVNNHCYGCTAGAGSSCGGALT